MGTSGAKAALVGPTGTLEKAFAPYATHTGLGGVVEQDPHEWLRALSECLASLSAHSYGAIALTGQMQDLVRYTGGALDGNAWLYSDTRAQREAALIHEALPAWEALTGNEQSSTSNAAMIFAGGSTQGSEFLFSPSGVILRKLGLGNHVDPTTASTTGLHGAGGWLEEVCEVIGVRTEQLPQISEGLIGRTRANNLGFAVGVPVYLAAGDAGSTTAGIIGRRPGADYLYLGSTGWHARVMSGATSAPGAVHRLAFGEHTLRIAALLSAASAGDWARSMFLGGMSAEQADAQLTERGYSGLTAIPSINGERFPVRSDSLGAGIVGMRASTKPIDCYRAMLESVALSLSLSCDPTEHGDLAVVGGGANSTPWMRIIADVIGRRVLLFDDADAALHGAAHFADEELAPLSRFPTRVIEPDAQAHASYEGAADKQLRAMEFLAGQNT